MRRMTEDIDCYHTRLEDLDVGLAVNVQGAETKGLEWVA